MREFLENLVAFCLTMLFCIFMVSLAACESARGSAGPPVQAGIIAGFTFICLIDPWQPSP